MTLEIKTTSKMKTSQKIKTTPKMKTTQEMKTTRKNEDDPITEIEPKNEKMHSAITPHCTFCFVAFYFIHFFFFFKLWVFIRINFKLLLNSCATLYLSAGGTKWVQQNLQQVA